jgi:hypothetical protein
VLKGTVAASQFPVLGTGSITSAIPSASAYVQI